MRLLRGIYNFLTNHRWGYLFFWGWNLIFGIMVITGFVPGVLIHVVPAVLEGLIPANFFVLSVIFMLTPFVFMYVGFRQFRDRPRALFGLLYGIEWPILAMLAFRFFAVKQLTPLMTFVFVVAGIAITIYGWQLLDDRIDKRGRIPAMLRVTGLSSLLMLGLYFVSIPGIMMPPLVRSFLYEVSWELRFFDLADLFSDIINEGADALVIIPMLIAYLTIFSLFGIALSMMPICIPVLYGRAWWRGVRAAGSRLGWLLTAGMTGLTAVALIFTFTTLSNQPQLDAHQLLLEPPTTLEEAHALEAQEDKIRAGLVDAYLAAYRYPGVSSDYNVAYDAWTYNYERSYYGREKMNMDALASVETAEKIGQVFARLTTPFNYRPMDAEGCEEENGWRCWQRSMRRWEADRAAELYQSYFDTPINEGENAVIVDAVRQTWNPDTAMSQWQAVDDREIWVKQQDVTITEHGDWAEVELHEVYVNQTFDRGEVVYFFSLPESAVVTSVWLGDDENGKIYEHVVAPRGAAQQVYQEQVQITRRDPALVEQIGPSQYRLRVYPVPQKTQRWDEGKFGWDKTIYEDGESLHMWLKFSVLGQQKGWPMPQLTEKRNAYWTDQSVRTINGEKIDTDDWLPSMIEPAAGISCSGCPAVDMVNRRVDLPNGQSVVILNDFKISREEPLVSYSVEELSHINAAVVLDRSYSMRDVSEQVTNTLSGLNEALGDVDLFLTSADNRGESSAWLSEFDDNDISNLFYFGGQNAAQLLQQYDELRDTFATSKQYDVVFVITDDSGYELGEIDFEVPRIEEPVWMIHLGSAPIGYDDDTLEVLQASGGGSVQNWTDAVVRYTLSAESREYITDTYDNRVWITMPTDEVDTSIPNDPAFAPIAARRYIISEMMANRGDLSDVDQLRDIHAIAVENSIVTPYSSMIVLVNEQQKDRLKELSEQDDAFEREFEEVGQTEMQATAVPEPEEWLLIIAGVCLLGYYIRKNRLESGASGFLSF